MERKPKTLARGNGKSRKWALGALVALTMVGAFASAGAGSAKTSPSAPSSPVVPENSVVNNRIWIDGMTGPGEWIDVESWSFGVEQTATSSSGGGGGAGKANFQDLHFTTHLSKYSPKILKSVATGEHIKKIIFEDFATAEKKGNETVYLRLTLSDCLITSYQTGGNSGGNDLPTESVSINFAKIEFGYNPQNKSGVGTAGDFKWDLKGNEGF